MSKYKIESSAKFQRELKRVQKRGWSIELLKNIVNRLASGETLTDFPWRDHPLKGDWSGYHECHVLDDWVLVYWIDKQEKILHLSHTGTHEDLKLQKQRKH